MKQEPEFGFEPSEEEKGAQEEAAKLATQHREAADRIKKAWSAIARNPVLNLVLVDLYNFVGPDRSPTVRSGVNVSPELTFVNIGRAEVWQHIQMQLDATSLDPIRSKENAPSNESDAE